ncbi:MAG: hypothetical protein QXT45_07505, partial [Candidatus Bilamarchaeaceae archaeon]
MATRLYTLLSTAALYGAASAKPLERAAVIILLLVAQRLRLIPAGIPGILLSIGIEIAARG